jgi:hypothetical protein
MGENLFFLKKKSFVSILLFFYICELGKYFSVFNHVIKNKLKNPLLMFLFFEVYKMNKNYI